MTKLTTTPEHEPKIAQRPEFITPEMVEQNPLLDMAGAFAGNPLYDEVVKEIEKERNRQRRRDARRASK